MDIDNISTCCLCREITEKLLSVVGEGGNMKDIILQHIRFFNFNDNEVNDKICTECWYALRDFHTFYLKIEEVNKSYNFLLRGPEDEADEKPFKEEILMDIKVEPFLDFDDDDDEPEKIETLSDPPSSYSSSSSSSEEEEFEVPKPKPKKRRRKVSKSETQKKEKDQATDSKNPRMSKKELIAQGEALIKEYFQIKCPFCSNEFETLTEMLSHSKIIHKKDGYLSCCGKNFKNRRDIRVHAMEHKDPLKYLVCDLCNKRFKSKKNMDHHKRTTHVAAEDRPFACEKCPKRFCLMSMLKNHMIFHEERRFKCTTCGKLASNQSLLNAHMKIHDTNHKFMCEVCSKSFPAKRDLQNHMVSHSTEKFQCTICGAWVKNVQKHMQVHVDLQLECPDCGKVVATKSALLCHIKYNHRPNKTYNCTFCDRVFKTAVNCKEHIATHTGEVLYSCPYCPATFNSNANMYRHRKLCEGRKMAPKLE